MDALYRFKLVNERNVKSMAAMQRVLDSCNNAIPVIVDQLQSYKSIITIKEAAISFRDKTITDVAGVLNHREKQIVRLKWQKAMYAVVGIITTSIMTYAYISK